MSEYPRVPKKRRGVLAKPTASHMSCTEQTGNPIKLWYKPTAHWAMFQTALNITDLSILTDNSTKAVHMFPSVRTGPVDISKAQELLDFTPTPWKTAVAETVDFYEKAMTNPYFHIPRKEIIRNMQTYFTSRPFKVLLGLKKHYGLDFQMPKEELWCCMWLCNNQLYFVSSI